MKITEKFTVVFLVITILSLVFSANAPILAGSSISGDTLAIEESQVVDVTLLGPRQYDRTSGQPNVYTDEFPGIEGTGRLLIQNGYESGECRISSAIIKINGIQVFRPNDFNLEVEYLETMINLHEDNEIVIELRSEEDSFITLSITQEIEAEAAAVIGSAGGVVEVTNPNSSMLGANLNIPEGALDQSVIIILSEGYIVDDQNYTGIPISCTPSGLQFNKDISITFPLENPYPSDDILMLLIYNEDSQLYESTGRFVEIYAGTNEITVNIDHFSSFVVTPIVDYFADLAVLINLITKMNSIKDAYEAGNFTELMELQEELIQIQDYYWDTMYDFTEAHGWCSEVFGFDDFIEKAEDAIYSEIISNGVPYILKGLGLATAPAWVSTLCMIPALAYWGSADICFLYTSFFNPDFIEAWVGYVICEYGIESIDFADLVSGVSQVISPGVPGPVQSEVPGWVPIVAGDENAACADDTSGPKTFVMARYYEAGRVVIIGHDGLIGSLDQLDNEQLVLNIISWLDSNDGKRVMFSTGHSEWVTASTLNPLKAELESRGYSFEAAAAPISSSFLAGRDVLIVGNAWGTISPSEIDAIESFVADGGGLFLIGLGWSWGHYHTTPIEEYPMMKLAVPFGVRWLECYLWDVYYDQSPVFNVFYPNIPN